MTALVHLLSDLHCFMSLPSATRLFTSSSILVLYVWYHCVFCSTTPNIISLHMCFEWLYFQRFVVAVRNRSLIDLASNDLKQLI